MFVYKYIYICIYVFFVFFFPFQLSYIHRLKEITRHEKIDYYSRLALALCAISPTYQ